MKIRYYLRGLGIGILITSIFFLVSSDNGSRTMTDEQVKARAKELGMIESIVLADISTKEAETVEETTEEIIEEMTLIEETTVEETIVEETTVEESTVEETTMEETVVEESSEQVAETVVEEEESEEVASSEEVTPNTSPVSIMVNRGEGSDTVARRLAEAGLVADAYEYDRYLMANGYDKRIGAGEHIIPAEATWEEIAKILCN